MKPNESGSRSHRWGLILAGGDGKRLLPLTRRIAGDDRPEQFCAILGDETLLHQTQRRVSGLVQSWRTLLVLTRTHEPFYADEVAGIPSSRLLIQPRNRGTAPAILFSLLRLREMDREGVVAFFPSDHHFSDDEAFIGHIDSAYAAAASRPDVVVLDSTRGSGGGVRLDRTGHASGRPRARVGSTRQPLLGKASRNAGRGVDEAWLWNSFVMVGHVRAFLNLIRQALPRLIEAFESIRTWLFTAYEKTALSELYSGIGATGFSQEVLSVRPNDLAVLCATGLGWSDLGEPGRVRTVLERKGVQTKWGFKPGLEGGQMLVRKKAAG